MMNAAAVAIELYLKCLSAELVFTTIDDEIGGYHVTAASTLKGLCPPAHLAREPDVFRGDLDRTFPARSQGLALRGALQRCDGAFAASRYPFERGAGLTKYPLSLLMTCSRFFGEYVAKLEPTDRIQWR